MLVIFDIDGTLSNCEARVRYIRNGGKDWSSFFGKCFEDKPIETTVQLCKMFIQLEHDVRIVTGRHEDMKAETFKWLQKHEISVPIEKIYMRKNNDFRHDSIIKPELVKEFIGSINLVFEDRTRVVQAWRKLGVTCFQVANGDF